MQHHYVPRLILRSFSHDGRHLHIMEKDSGKVFGAPIDNSFSISDFNKVVPTGLLEGLSEDEIDVEGILDRQFETPVGAIFQRITASRQLILSPKERVDIINFMAIQWARTPGSFLRQRCALGGPAPKNKMRPLGKAGDGEDELRDVKLSFMPVDTRLLATVLQRADLYLHSLEDGEFLLGDDPVIVIKGMELPENLVVNYDISGPGSQVFLPIAPDLGLHLYTRWDAGSGSVGGTHREPVVLDARHRNHLNNLQVKNALSYVISKSGIFQLG